MTRADFYILDETTAESKFTCTITNKVYQQGHSIYIDVPNHEIADKIENLLWTYHDISFIPHALADTDPSKIPVVIGWPGTEPVEFDVLINLTDRIPESAASFSRIIEIIPSESSARQHGRERFKQYRGLGFELFSHDIGRKQ